MDLMTFIFLLSCSAFGWDGDQLNASEQATISPATEDSSRAVIDTTMRDPLTGTLPANEKRKLREILGEWEEPRCPSDPLQVR
jgi:hypothetical protein